MENKYLILVFALLLFTHSSCKKIIEIKAPVTSINMANVYTTDATATSVLTGMYINLSMGSMNGGYFTTGTRGVAVHTGLSSDELTLFNGVSDLAFKAYYQNALVEDGSRTFGSESWSTIYNSIFTCNSAIEGIKGSTSLSAAVQQQLLGEAVFLRAYFYFYLVNLFGDVPLLTSSDYKVNLLLSRASSEKVYGQIIDDLKEATDLLSVNYVDGNLKDYLGLPERVRPTKWAAKALLARTYLYIKDYVHAEREATDIINHSSLFNLVSLGDVF